MAKKKTASTGKLLPGELSMKFVRENDVQIMGQQDFINSKGWDISTQALQYAMKKGHVNWVRISGFRHVCLTSHTATYVPRQKNGAKTKEEKAEA